jgi:hypothetical protein
MKALILVLLGAALVLVGIISQQVVYALRPPEISGRTSAEMLEAPFASLMPTGDLELVARYTPPWVETSGCKSLCMKQFPHCALLERVILTNDPGTLRTAFFDSARRLGWNAKDGPYPYRGVDHRLDKDAVLAEGFWTTLELVDLDRTGTRESRERSLGLPLDATLWRYVAVLRIEDAPAFLQGRCASTLWRLYAYPTS